MAGMLYLVPTPIGNLSDISPRCRQTLAEADFIAAEDTRVSLKLLNHLELKMSLVSYHEHNKAESGEKILARLLAGETCALVTDAGSPAISDPGEDLVRLCAEHGVTVCAIPGPCALVTALSISGLPTGRFTFEGFLSVNKKSRQEHLTGLKDETRTMIFYEAPHKLLATLQDLSAAFGAERKISLCRELTKLHEEVRRTTLGEAAAYYAENPPRGEFVLVVAGAEEPAEEGCTFEGALALVRARMDEGLSTKDAVKQVAKLTGFAKNQLYDAILKGSTKLKPRLYALQHTGASFFSVRQETCFTPAFYPARRYIPAHSYPGRQNRSIALSSGFHSGRQGSSAHFPAASSGRCPYSPPQSTDADRTGAPASMADTSHALSRSAPAGHRCDQGKRIFLRLSHFFRQKETESQVFPCKTQLHRLDFVRETRHDRMPLLLSPD